MKLLIPLKDETQEKKQRTFTRRYVQIDKFCNSIIKDIKPNNGKFILYKFILIMFQYEYWR